MQTKYSNYVQKHQENAILKILKVFMKMYGKVARRTVAVRGHHGTVQQLYKDTDDRKNKSRPVEADPTVVKTLRTVLCSSHDGVPLK